MEWDDLQLEARPCLHEENLPLMGGLPWIPSQLLASAYMRKSKFALPDLTLRELGRVTFSLLNISYSITLSGLKSTKLNWHGHLYCFKQLIKDSIIIEVKVHLLSWGFADDFDCYLAFAVILEITKFTHTHFITSCPSQKSQRGTECLLGKKLSRLLASPYFAKRVTLPLETTLSLLM